MDETEIQSSPFESEEVELEDEQIEDVDELEDIDEENIDDEQDEEDFDDTESDGEDLEDDDIDSIIEEILGEEESEVSTVPHAALHKERMRRKELQSQIGEVSMREAQLQAQLGEYEKTMASVKEKLKEYGLDDDIELNAPKDIDPEVLQMRQQKEAQAIEAQMTNTITELRDEASDYVYDYPSIDVDNPEQAELIMGLALSSHILGAEKEDAVNHALGLVNKIILNQRKQDRRKQTPRKRVVGTKTKGARQPRNTKEFFENLAQSIGD